MNDRDATIRKVRSLFAKTTAAGCKPDESASAFALASRLMVNHGLTLADVTELRVVHVREPEPESKPEPADNEASGASAIGALIVLIVIAILLWVYWGPIVAAVKLVVQITACLVIMTIAKWASGK